MDVATAPAGRTGPARRVPQTGLSRAQVAVAFDRNPLGFLLDNARTYGPVVQLCPGTVMVTGRVEVMAVLKATGNAFSDDRDFLNRELGSRHEGDSEQAWLAARRIAIAEMTPDRIDRHMAWFVPRAEAFADLWLLRGTVTELRENLEHLTAASIARFCLGDRADGAVSASAQELLDALFPVFASPYRLPSLIRRLQPRERRVRRALGEFNAVLGGELADLGGCPADNLAAAMHDGGLADDSLLGPVRSLLLAAHDVPASALAWAIVELARSPRMQDFVAEGAASWNGIGTPPREIGWFVHETLRLWPPTWGLSRHVAGTTACGDWLIPAGSTVIVPLWVLHRVAASFADPDPERFEPGRWANRTPRPGEFLPFSGGPRWCPGERLARAELAAVVTTLARRTRLGLRGEPRPDIRRTLTPRGFTLEVSPR